MKIFSVLDIFFEAGMQWFIVAFFHRFRMATASTVPMGTLNAIDFFIIFIYRITNINITEYQDESK